MSDGSAPSTAGAPPPEPATDAPRVRVLLTVVEGADLGAAVAAVQRQVYEPAPEIVVVGDIETDLGRVETLDEGIGSSTGDVDYLWLLHADARPRPDALRALVAESERTDAALAGSKLLVAGTENYLESVGSATDVFGEPYTGLDEGEIDLQQYDVVREVAFVWSASMLVRRDLAQGLKGLDPLLPPVAAGLDFSQRTRLAGGRVVTVPSSEVYHQDRCEERRGGWREQAGRLRSMITAYSPLTLAWVIPYDLVVSVLDSLANLLLMRWRPAAGYLRSWAWNVFHLPSTIGQRRRFRPVRAARDEELFRFQARGSVRLRETGSELTGRILSVFDDDQALVRRTRRVWASPGIWGALLAGVIVFVSARSLIFGGLGATGFSFPFESATASLSRWFGGWNDSGLGSPSAVHPSVGLTGLISWLWFGAEGASRTLMTFAFGILGVVGMGRLAGRLGLRGPGRYLAGLVLFAGPGTALLAEKGSWLALGAAALLPWVVRAVFHNHSTESSWWSRYGWALLLGVPLAAMSPLLVLTPAAIVVLWQLAGGRAGRVTLAATVAATGVTAAAFVIGDPGWLTDANRRLGVAADSFWLVLIVLAALPLTLAKGRRGHFGTTGAVLALASLLGAQVLPAGPGVEEALLITASLGTALVVAAGLDEPSLNWRNALPALGAAAILVVSVSTLGNGRLGLPGGDANERLAFAETLSDEGGPGRVLLASETRSDIPGEARPGAGFWYRLIDGLEMTHDEVWLPEPRVGDRGLEDALDRIASGSELRPGLLLAEYAVDWVVLLGNEFDLDHALASQLDLVPTPLDPDARVYDNPEAEPLASADSTWVRHGPGFKGLPDGRVVLAINFAAGWADGEQWGWRTSVDPSTDYIGFGGNALSRGLAMASIALLGVGLVLVAVGRRRR